MNTEQSIEELEQKVKLLQLQLELNKLEKKLTPRPKPNLKHIIPTLLLYLLHLSIIALGMACFIVDDGSLWWLILSGASLVTVVLSIVYKKKWLHYFCLIFDAINIFVVIMLSIY
jgi:hypothetical protein